MGQSRSAPMMSRDLPVAAGPAVREMSQVADDPLADFGQTVRKAAELVLRVRGALDSEGDRRFIERRPCTREELRGLVGGRRWRSREGRLNAARTYGRVLAESLAADGEPAALPSGDGFT